MRRCRYLGTYSSKQRKIRDRRRPPSSRDRPFDVLPEQRSLPHALVGESAISVSRPRTTGNFLAPRIGTTQKLQYLLQPSMIETKALGPFHAGRRELVEFFDLPGGDIHLPAGRSFAERRSIPGAGAAFAGEHEIA